MASITPNTWNQLGLGVATSWVGLGLLSIFRPAQVAETFGFSASPSVAAQSDTTILGLLIGSRDLAIAATLLSLGRSGRNHEMGTVIISTLIISGVDIFLVWKKKKYLE